MRIGWLMIALVACGNDKPKAEKVTSFVRNGYRFQVPKGWSADLRLVDIVTITPDNPAEAAGKSIVVGGMSAEAVAGYKTATAEYCSQGFKSADAVKPPGQLYGAGALQGCVSDYTRSGRRQRRWDVSDGKAGFSLACNRVPGDQATAELCEEIVTGARPEAGPP